MERITVFKETDEDWYPSYLCDNRKMVRVIFLKLFTGQYRVAVWGDDDFGMERDLDDFSDAWDDFERVISAPLVKRDFLTKLGFINA